MNRILIYKSRVCILFMQEREDHKKKETGLFLFKCAENNRWMETKSGHRTHHIR